MFTFHHTTSGGTHITEKRRHKYPPHGRNYNKLQNISVTGQEAQHNQKRQQLKISTKLTPLLSETEIRRTAPAKGGQNRVSPPSVRRGPPACGRGFMFNLFKSARWMHFF